MDVDELAQEERRQQMQDEYKARYRDEVDAEIAAQEKDWREETPAKCSRFREELRERLEKELWEKVKALFAE